MSSLVYKEIWSHPNKPLKEHLENVAEIIKFSVKDLPLNFHIEKTIISEILYYLGLYHDIGKATIFFQEYLREENEDKKARLKNNPFTKHSLISAVATYFVIEEYLKETGLNNDFLFFIPIASFISVKRHHTDLQFVIEDIRITEDEIKIIKEQLNNFYTDYLSFLPKWKKVFDSLKALPDSWPLGKLYYYKWFKKRDRGVLLYFIQHLFYSLLLDADKHEVIGETNIERKVLVSDMVDRYKNKMFSEYKKQSKINILREEIYEKVINQVEKIEINKDHILLLSAPTGSGKTLTSYSFALKLREKIIKEKGYYPRIVYCLPYLSIIDQNAEIINEVFLKTTGTDPSSDYFLIHHHLSDYNYKKDDIEYEIDKSEVFIEGWDSEVIITTFVQLFHTLFTNRNKLIRKFHKISGSIIILDEIQSFPHNYWLLFKETIECLSKYFNTYFIISTATQPSIFENFKELVTDKEKYFNLFERTKISINIEPSLSISDFINYLLNSTVSTQKSTLVVLNTISSAEEVFKGIKDILKEKGFEVYYLSSHIVPLERLRRIEMIKNSKNKKLEISTQLIEAGVDISLERIIRDIGPFDSINQVAGRGNRNFEYKDELAKVEIVKVKSENGRILSSYIYDPVLIDVTEKIIKENNQIPESLFLNLSNKYYDEIKKRISDNDSKEIINYIKELNYEKITNFKLIKDEVEKIDIFIELEDEAARVWENYCELLEIEDLLERKKQFLKIKKKFYSYVISVVLRKAYKNLPPEVNGIRFVSKNQLNNYYDIDTGFKINSDFIAW